MNMNILLNILYNTRKWINIYKIVQKENQNCL